MNRSQSASNPVPPPDPDRERIDCHQRAMAQLIEIGMALAETLRPQAGAATEAGPEPAATEPVPAAADPALRFSRIARVVVLAVTTEGWIIADRRKRADEMAAVAARGDKVRRVMRVERLMEEAITRARPDEDDAADLRDELYWRFEDLDPEVDLDFGDRPIGETIDRLCRDLGVEPDWSWWAKEDWAIAEARDKPHGSPYAGPCLSVRTPRIHRGRAARAAEAADTS
ncbi:MAG TPA: hypothetical protein VK597_08470 [Inquilinus sp.]|nr:hypothetical protein [Inquilinus sp.]